MARIIYCKFPAVEYILCASKMKILTKPNPHPHRPTHRHHSNRPDGFALIITISLMMVLTLLAVGLLSLSSLSLRSSTRGSLRQSARANAKMALLIALAELQRTTGPDQRITASAGILDPAGSPPSSRSHLTGVWKGWKWDGQGAPNYASHKQDDFLGWLVSARDRDALLEQNYAQSSLPEDDTSVRLVGEGSVPDTDDHLYAERVPINVSGSGLTGNYAWAVLDQGQKALINLPDSEVDTLADKLAELTAPPVPGFQSVTALGRDWKALHSLGNARSKLVSQGQIPLAGVDLDSPTFHDLTAHSTGLAVNAAEGGLSHDLSLLFDQDKLPTEFERRFLYSDDDRPLVNGPRRFRGANVMPAPDPSWKLLHSHARLHTKVRNAARQPTIGTSVIARPPAGFPASRTLFHPHFTQQQLAPVIAKAQFVFSLGFGASPRQAKGGKEAAAQSRENWVIWLVTDPVITLWNPYDVSLTFKRARIDLHRVPLAFQIFRNGRSFAPPTLFANSYLPGDFKGRGERYYRLNIKPAMEADGQPQDSITMKPGEHLVFTAHNHVKHYKQQYMLEGVDLRPGWHAPAGEDSDRFVGGISSLNLCVTSSGKNSARINGVSTRVIPVKAGDRIQIAVSQAHANVDRMSETDNKEITTSLKYYVENDGSSSSSNRTPPLVGAIELDYGKREKEILPSFSQRDLPAIVVPRGMTNIQGDNNRVPPPPNCRHKEPFLITSLHLKTEKDSRVPSRGWIHNGPTNLYASIGLDQKEADNHHQYEFSWEPMTDWTSSPTVEIDADNRGFGASGIYAQTGREIAPFAGIPLAPLTSMAQLRHAPINSGGQLPLQTQIVANSFPNPLLPANQIQTSAGSRSFLDHSFLANQALFDNYFFSSISAQSSPVFAKNRSTSQVVEDFFADEQALPNSRIRPFLSPESPAPDASDLTDPESGFKEVAAQLGIEGAFNVNSTSVAAWQAILASLQPEETPNINTQSGRIGRTGGEGTLISRQVPPLDNQLDGITDPLETEAIIWHGHRRLSDENIARLAESIVEQIKTRGPFQSLAEFVNRRLEFGDLGRAGALQAAIDESGINAEPLAAALTTIPEPRSSFPEAAEGTTTDGAPAVINQADLLTSLAPIISVRSDTFVIRCYGEATSGNSTARAWCEATVQRTPAFLDPATPPTADVTNFEPDGPDARFGRRYQVLDFRWLSPEEV